VEDPLSESILNKHFGRARSWSTEPDPDKPNEKRIVFRAVEASARRPWS
jgi:hypothetical protein